MPITTMNSASWLEVAWDALHGSAVAAAGWADTLLRLDSNTWTEWAGYAAALLAASQVCLYSMHASGTLAHVLHVLACSR